MDFIDDLNLIEGKFEIYEKIFFSLMMIYD